MSNLASPASPSDHWVKGDLYEGYMGRWSRRVAVEFLEWLDRPAGEVWLDVGCGSGALSQAILAIAHPGRVKGIDSSAGYIARLQQWMENDRVHFELGDAQSLEEETGTYDAAVSGLVLNFIPDPARAVGEMARTVKPGGMVAAYVWDYGGKMQMLRHFWDAASAFDSKARDLDEGKRFPLCLPGPLAGIFRGAGLASVEVRGIEIATDFDHFDDYWWPFLGGQGPAPGYVQSLDEEARVALRERIRAGLPISLDGSISLSARAWAVRGVRR